MDTRIILYVYSIYVYQSSPLIVDEGEMAQSMQAGYALRTLASPGAAHGAAENYGGKMSCNEIWVPISARGTGATVCFRLRY